jgi:hypothetical protein
MALPGLFRTIPFWPIEMRPHRIRGGGFCGRQKPICLRMSGYGWMSGGTTCQTVRARRSWSVVPGHVPHGYREAVLDLVPGGAPPDTDLNAAFELSGIAAAYIEMVAVRSL